MKGSPQGSCSFAQHLEMVNGPDSDQFVGVEGGATAVRIALDLLDGFEHIGNTFAGIPGTPYLIQFTYGITRQRATFLRIRLR